MAVFNRERNLVIDLFAAVAVQVPSDMVKAVYDFVVFSVQMAHEVVVAQTSIAAAVSLVPDLPDVDGPFPVFTFHTDPKVHPAGRTGKRAKY